MAYPTAAGVASHSGSLTPVIYARKLMEEFYPRTVFGSIANTDYEGEIKKYGDEVKIRQLPDAVVNDYTVGQDLEYDRPEPGVISLLIDKGKYFAFAINTVQQKQADIEFVGPWAEHHSQQMKVSVDTDILSDIYADAAAANMGATAGVKSESVNLGAVGSALELTKSNVVDFIAACNLVLDEQNVPDEGRWMVLPARAVMLIKTSELKDASITGDNKSILRSGRIGMIDRTEIYSSNNVASVVDGGTTCWKPVFGHKIALTFAAQLTEKQVIDNPNDFGQLLRALMVYGYKVAKPDALGSAHIAYG